ncbi:MAG: CsiV family protein [Gammaproteobacteria bacterium]|jgi:hypothetical protein
MSPESKCRTSSVVPFAFILAVVAVLAAPPPAFAVNRWYQVEVIVFRYANPSAAEQAVSPAKMPDFRNAVSLATDLSENGDAPAERPNEVTRPGPVPYKALPRSELITSGVYRRLRDLSAYEPVLHVGWRQPGGALGSREVYVTDKVREPADVVVDMNAVPLPEISRIEGTVRVRTGRLLHVETDFLDYGQAAPVRISERRKVKFKELHYFDNPFFGVIVQVTPYRVEPLQGVEEDAEVSSED